MAHQFCASRQAAIRWRYIWPGLPASPTSQQPQKAVLLRSETCTCQPTWHALSPELRPCISTYEDTQA